MSILLVFMCQGQVCLLEGLLASPICGIFRDPYEKSRDPQRKLGALALPPDLTAFVITTEPAMPYPQCSKKPQASWAGAYKLADRACRVFGRPHYEHLSIPQKVA